MQNIKPVINNHNMKVLSNTAKIEEGCNCRHRNNFPLDLEFLTPNIIYEAQITSNQRNYKQKVYIGTAETDFKRRFNNHTKSANLEHYENGTELSKEYWAIKRNQSLLTSVDTRTNIPFYCMIAKSKSYVFTVVFLAAFLLEPAFLTTRLMFCIMFSKTEIKQLRSTVSLENVAGNISCEDNTKMTSTFRLDTNTR